LVAAEMAVVAVVVMVKAARHPESSFGILTIIAGR
jgi:hypothetical protein